MEEDIKSSNKNPFVALLVIGIVLVGGWFLYTRNTTDITWKGFYYKNAKYSTNLIDQQTRLDQAPTFSTLQDCMKWGKDYLRSNLKDGFECSYGCRIDGEWGIVCKDTTKMITNISNEGFYTE